MRQSNLKNLTPDLVEEISKFKNEPNWMRDKRLEALRIYLEKPMPSWGVDLQELENSDFNLFEPAKNPKARNWEEVPLSQKKVYEDLNIPLAERKFLSGVETQYDSSVVYGRIKKSLEEIGVIFTDTDSAVLMYPDLVKKWFGKVIPSADNKFSALNTALWSGGSFVYVPKGVKVPKPIQAYFFINERSLGQFERTLIIADEGAEVSYIEGCSAPEFSDTVLHSGVVELVAMTGAKIRYTTIQNWSQNVYNLVTQRGLASKDARIEWVDCNLGSQVTMKYPSVILAGRKAFGKVTSLSVASRGQKLDSGGKMIHLSPDTTSQIVSKSICKEGGIVTYRGKVEIKQKNCFAKVECDSLILDSFSKTNTYPTNICVAGSRIEHEASVSKISQEMESFLESRGLSQEDAGGILLSGFASIVSRELPMEYAMELNQLLRKSWRGSVG